MLTREVFEQIREEELSIGIVRPILQNLVLEDQCAFEEEIKAGYEGINLIEQKKENTLEYQTLRKMIYQQFFYQLTEDFVYASIIWKQPDGTYYDCLEDLALEKVEVLEDFCVPLSMFYHKEEIQMINYADEDKWKETSFSLLLPKITLDQEYENALVYWEEKYKEQAFEKCSFTKEEEDVVRKLAKEYGKTSYDFERPKQFIDLENIYLAIIGNGMEQGVAIVQKVEEENTTHYFNLSNFSWVDFDLYYLRDLEPISWYYDRTEIDTVIESDPNTNQLIQTVKVTNEKPLLAYYNRHREDSVERNPLVYQKSSSSYFS